jgi:mRNA interferase RelE/StbE
VASYSLAIKKSAAKELADLPGKDCGRIAARIEGLAAEPRPPGSEKLSGEERYRLRQGVYRILYEVDDRARRVVVVKIAHRREVYR